MDGNTFKIYILFFITIDNFLYKSYQKSANITIKNLIRDDSSKL